MLGVGGAERVVDSLSTLLVNLEREVHQATFDPPSAQRHFYSTVPLHPIGPIPRLPLPLRPLGYLLTAWRLHKLKKRLGIDVTISNLWGADLISILSSGSDRKIALCHINVVHNPSNRLMVRLRPLVAAVYRRFDRVITVSETLAQELKALYRLPPSRISHINNFVDRPDAVSRLPSDALQRFVWCGRLSPEKNVEGLLRVWSGFVMGQTDAQLVLLGDGQLRDSLILLTARLGLRAGSTIDDISAQVVFAGKVSDPADYMLGARALLLSSHAEGLPMVVLEALSLGLPVLASDCQAGGVRTALQGNGICDPDRTSTEYTPAGALLPVPTGARPFTLAIWREALTKASRDDVQWAAWCEGALTRATHFNSAAVRHRWLKAIDFHGADQ
jgi:glycosyltransferase involved in cell wall biosynthesis